MSLVWQPDDDFLTRSNAARLARRVGAGSLEELQRAWIGDVGAFWTEVAADIGFRWLEPPAAALDRSGGEPWADWWPGGVTNLVLSCVERHDPERLALVWEGEEGTVRRLDYGELSQLVSRVAGGLRALGVGRGDRVGVYLPHLPEVVACLYACAKLGAVYVPMFSGFAEEPVATRLADAGAKVLVTADAFTRRGRRIEMRAVAERAAASVSSVEHVVVVPRLGEGNWDAFLEAEPVLECEPVAADHPFLVVYTSGTTGRPKGAVHSHGGFPLKAATETAYHSDQRDGDLLFWMTDTGWIMSPLTIVGTGATGEALLLYDGAPDHPGPARIAEVVRRHEVAVLGTSPTWIRALVAHDETGFDGDPGSLRVLASTGEPWNEGPWRWFFEQVGGGRCPIANIAGGTECGSLFATLPLAGVAACAMNTPSVGVDATIFGSDSTPAAIGEVGELVVRQPFPGRTHGFWGDDERYLDSYWRRWPGIWVHGDWATRDADGQLFLHGRSDDTMLVAGRRVGPAEIESALVEHPDVIEAAAIGVPDEVKGEAVWCFAVAREGSAPGEDELRAFVGERLGKAFRPERVLLVAALPRTRNAKVLRRVVRAVATGVDPGDLSSLDNPEAIEAVRAALATGGPE